MESFQKTVVIIAFVILILFLIVIGFMLRKSENSQTWPPIVPECPDYWIDLSGNGSKCVNTKNLGTCNANPGPLGHSNMDFTQAPYVGSNGMCSKYTWAKTCGLTWDGITSGVANPCDTTTTSTS